MRNHWIWWTMLLVAGALLFGACTGSSPEPAPTATATTAEQEIPAATPMPTVTEEPEDASGPRGPTPTATATPSPTPSPTPTPTPLPFVTITTTDGVVHKEGEQDVMFDGFGFGGRAVKHSLERPEGLNGPEPAGTGYYALIPLGTQNEVAVMVDIVGGETYNITGTLYVSKTADGTFGEGAVEYSFRSCCTSTREPVSYVLDYDGEKVPMAISVSANAHPIAAIEPTPAPAGETPTPRPTPTPAPASYQVSIHMITATARIGRIPETGELFILDDESGRGRFDALEDMRVGQDLDGDTIASQSIPGEIQPAQRTTLVGAEGAWEIHSVSPSGRTVQLIPKEKGVVAGTVRTLVGANPLEGATIRVMPGGFETTTGPDGSYRLEVYGGDIWNFSVTAEGYIPFMNTYLPGGRRDGSQQERIFVREGATTSLDVELAELQEENSGTIVLKGNGSFFGALGLAFSDIAAGDFHFNVSVSGQGERVDYRAELCACREGQRGLVEIEERSAPLDQITISPIGYTRNLIFMRPGYVYIVKAREGLEGHFVLFRITAITQEGVEISYLYR